MIEYARFYLIGLTVLAVLTGCGDESKPAAAATKSPLGPVPAAEQRPGDPEAGYRALINNAYITCGIPYSAYLEATDSPTASHSIPGRVGRNAELPHRLTAHTSDSGVELVTSNCLGCHAAEFNGELIIGLGNEFLDFTNDPVLAVESAGAYVNGEAEAAEWRKWADRINAIGPYIMTDTVGVNSANNLTLALLAHRDPETLAWSQEPLLELPPEKPLPVSVPPWWRMKKKHAMFYNAEGRGDHASFMMLASTTCTDTVDEARRIDAYFTDIRAYIASLEPPDYPYPIDEPLAKQGQDVFETHCSRCHGTYGETWTYPNLVVGLEEIGTDPELAVGGFEQADRFIQWFNSSFYGERSQAAPALGYIAPPLDGVWATAPYLHNGSVPTIEALLNSKARPKFWRHASESPDYDQDTLGWQYTELSQGKDGFKKQEDRKRVYDTTLKGYSNGGHMFGDVLSDDDRGAVLEYLKSL